MRPEKREWMHERVDRTQLARDDRAIERDHYAGNGPPAEAHADEVTGLEIEPGRDQVAERARGPAQAGEDGDLRRTGGHSSKCRGFFISFRTISAISFTVLS